MLSLILHLLALTMLTLAYSVWRARSTSDVNVTFSAFVLAITVWISSIAFVHGSTMVDPWVRLSFAGASFIPSTFLSFVRVYPTLAVWPTLRLVSLVKLLACVFAFVSLFTDLIAHD